MDVRVAVEEFKHAKFRLSQQTLRGYMQRLSVFVAWCERQGLALENIKATHVRAFVEEVSQRSGKQGGKIRRSTLRMYTTVVKSFLAWCAKEEDFEDLVSPKVASRVEAPKLEQVVIETFTPEQIEALFAVAEKGRFAVRNKAILAVLIDTGARASEVMGLTLDRVWLDVDDSYIKVMGKGRKEREIALGRVARIALRRYITRHRKPRQASEKKVFLARTGKPLTVSGLQQIISRLGAKAHIEGVRCSCHTFRHTMACMYLLNGGDIYKLSRLMGHESVKITERYLQSVKARQARQGGESVLDRLKSL